MKVTFTWKAVSTHVIQLMRIRNDVKTKTLENVKDMVKLITCNDIAPIDAVFNETESMPKKEKM